MTHHMVQQAKDEIVALTKAVQADKRGPYVLAAVSGVNRTTIQAMKRGVVMPGLTYWAFRALAAVVLDVDTGVAPDQPPKVEADCVCVETGVCQCAGAS